MNVNGGCKTKRELLASTLFNKPWKLLEHSQQITILSQLVDELMEELQKKEEGK